MQRMRKRKEPSFLWRFLWRFLWWFPAATMKLVPYLAHPAFIIIKIIGLMWLAVGFLPTLLSAEAISSCKTVAGPSSGMECVFPFQLGGVSHMACTLHGSSPGNPWCSTKVDASGEHIGGHWGDCGPECPFEGR